MKWSRSECYLSVFLYCFGFLINYGITENIDCLTPDEVGGTCVPLKKCASMIDLVRTLERPFSDTVTERLNAFKCRSYGTVKICCPPDLISLEPKTPEPPDVTHHKNVNILPTTCGYQDSSIRIVNGKNARLNEFPWMALLQYQTGKGRSYHCGGSIIHKNYILTAAHCVVELLPGYKLVTIRVGEHSIKNETDCELQDGTLKCNPAVQDLKIEEIIPHPQFGGREGNQIHDIALVRVSTINLEVENARPVCLPVGVVRDFPFRGIIVTGWGVTNTTSGNKSDILQKVGLKVADKKACKNEYAGYYKIVTYSQLCAGGDSSKDSCTGDSGGPAVVATVLSDYRHVYIQQGIVSYGPGLCGNSSMPGIYTQVKYYMDWILDTIKP